MIDRALRIVLPILLFAGLIWFWEWAVGFWQIKKFVLPAPSAIWQALVEDDGTLYTAVYRPLDASVELVWPGAVWRQSCAEFHDEVRIIRFNDGDSGGFAPTFKQGAVSS